MMHPVRSQIHHLEPATGDGRSLYCTKYPMNPTNPMNPMNPAPVRFKPIKEILYVLSVIILLFSLLPQLSANKLTDKSPFLPPGHGVKEPEITKPPVQSQGPISRQIEFRGIVQLGEVLQFSVFNKKDQKSYWLKENENKAGISISSYDESSTSIIVFLNGRSERLELHDATENPLPVAQAIAGTPQKNARPAVLPPGLNNRQPVPNRSSSSNNRVPRRRVILPKKTN
ncbi:MAG: hypothetical protein ACPGSB_03900 [Opitutales bacterium]